MAFRTVMGQESWEVSSPNVRASVTKLGGMLGPIEFDLPGRTVSPLSVAPWHSESAVTEPALLGPLRGDFFCMPFGGSPEPYLGENHPLHGESANNEWQFDNASDGTLDLVLDCQVRKGRIYKTVRCGDGAVYQRHTLLGVAGPMSFGMHCMVKFRSPGILTLPKLAWGQVFPGRFEDPAAGGYSSLAPGAEFTDLESVTLETGGTTDLGLYPAREGFEDLAQVATDPKEGLGWSAVTFPGERFAFFQLKNPRILTGTVLWFSNGGRHYPPWNGRHRAVLGIEEATTYFHLGLRGSVSPNPMQAAGFETFKDLDPREPLEIKTIIGVVDLPDGFDKVVKVVPSGSGVVLVAASGVLVEKSLDLMFLGLT
ncbi:MAG: hypothetical protein JSS66_09585 [Armatimonadetes bacterium]|nr:hypothetical protein [Armatimonadota bacterium]